MPDSDPNCDCETLIGCFRRNVDTRPDKVALIYLADGESERQSLTYCEWYAWSSAIADRLLGLCAPGEPVLMPMETSLDFLAGFMGGLLAGMPVVPLPSPAGRAGWRRLQAVARDSGARTLITRSHDLALAQARQGATDFLRDFQAVATDQIASTGHWSTFAARPETPAFLQYTSGSTGDPKGVVVTHANLIHNERLIRHAMGNREDSVFLTWLPLFHDMGLICTALQSLYLRSTCYLMPPASFIQRPLRWLEAISRFGVTSTGAPNFAYDLCVDKAASVAPGALDLSRWELAFNGAEPVRGKTLRAFTVAFRPSGFHDSAFFPGYGMAEATLLVSGSRSAEGPLVVRFDEQALARGQAAPSADTDAVDLVRCGHGLPGQTLRIVSPSTRAALPDNAVGEIWIRGDSITAGYWNRPDATAADFGARLSGDGSGETFLRTGDLGFLHDGGLYIAGRLKDLIVIRGMNHYPQDIEYTVDASHPDLMAHGSAAFSVTRDNDERLVVVAELTRAGLQRRNTDAVIAAVIQAVAVAHELVVDAVALVRPGHLPKTTSGKVQRSACREAWRNGELGVVAAHGRTAGDGASAAAAGPAESSELAVEIARLLKCRAGDIPADCLLTACGMDSLAAMQLQEHLRARRGLSISLTDLLEGVTLAALQAKLDAGSGANDMAVETWSPVSRCADNQRALWLHRQARPASAAYHVTAAFSLHGGVDEKALGDALKAVVTRHEVLRSTFAERDGRIDLHLNSGTYDVLQRSSLNLAELAALPFDLVHGPLFRAFLLDNNPAGPVLVLSAHHSVVDLWSMALLMADLGEHYGHLTGQAEAPQWASAQYRDFVGRQQQMLAGERGRQHRDYWRTRCAAMPAPLQAAGARVASDDDDRAQSITGRVGRETSDAVKALARDMAVTPFTVMLGAFRAAFARTGSTGAGTLGVTTSGRDQPEMQKVVGYTVNVLPVALDIRPGVSFRSLVAGVQQEMLSVLAHSAYPLQLIQEDLDPRMRGRLFRIAFVWQHLPVAPGLASAVMRQAGDEIQWGELTLRSMQVPLLATPFDLTFSVIESGDEFAFTAEYRTSVYDAAVMQQLCDAFTAVVTQAIRDPDHAVATAPATAAADRPATADAFTPVHAAFAHNAKTFPERTALVEGERRLGYAALNNQAERIAARLVQAGIGPGAVAAICLPRSIDAVAAMLGILKSGAAYTPVLPEWPEQRKSLVLQESGAACIVTRRELLPGLPDTLRNTAILVGDDASVSDSLPAPVAGTVPPDLPAYILFTSGTTGRPKGVTITHANLAAYVDWAARYYLSDTSASRGFALFTSLGFDLTLTSIFAPLVGGTHAIVFPDEIDDNALMARVFQHPEVGVVKATPSHMRLVQNLSGPAGSVHTLILGGEALPTKLASDLTARLGARLRIFNEYGPTEATVGCICHLYDVARDTAPDVPIGIAVAGARVALLDDDLRPVAPGEPGELFLAGPGVAAGYRGRPAQTAAAFIPDIGGHGGRMYRTGDLACLRSDGTLAYLGRRDEQIKWRGVRIEPHEICARLERYPGIRESVVALATGPAGTDVLCAWYVADSAFPAASLRRFLADTLPDNMLPVFLMQVASLPLSANGKLDRPSLPAPRVDSASVAPRTPVEAVIYQVWREILGLDEFGVTDRFAALGGDSISAMRVAARLGEQGLSVRIRDIFEHRTIERLALAALPVAAPPQASPVHAFPETDLAPSPMAVWFFAQRMQRPEHYHQVATFHCPGDLRPDVLRDALGVVRAHHAALRLNVRPGGTSLWVNEAQLAQPVMLPAVDLRHLSELQAEMEQAEAVRQVCASTDLAAGPLFQPLLFELAGGWQLVIAAHHLAVDVVSWRILAEDLTLASRALCRGQQPRLAQATGPGAWTDALERFGQSPDFTRQLSYWDRAERSPRTAAGNSTVRRVHRETIWLGTLSTAAEDGQQAVETVLLASAARALQQRFNARHLLVEMEHHGRNVPGVDLSRTVGWLTSLYPLALALPDPDAAPDEWLSVVNEQRRRVPDDGVGYGVVRCRRGAATPDPWAPAMLRMNYLGAWRHAGSSDHFVLDPARSYLSSAEANAPGVLLELNAYAVDDSICVEAGFEETCWTAADRDCFIAAFGASFRALAGSASKPAPAPARMFEEAGLSEHELNTLLA